MFATSCAQVPKKPVPPLIIERLVVVEIPGWMTMPTTVDEPEYVTTDDLPAGIQALRSGILSCNADKVRIATYSHSEAARGTTQTRGN